MRFVSRFASRGPNDKKGHIVNHTDALKSAFVVRIPNIFASQEVAVKERP